MAISNYTELQAAVGNWLNRSDLTSRIPEFIALAEARFNRMIWTPDTETSDTQTTASITLTYPSDFRALRQLYVTVNSCLEPLSEISAIELRNCFEGVSGIPTSFAIVNNQPKLGPAPDQSYTFTFEYHKTIPPLASNSTNWLLTSHPDVYLYASLVQSEAFTWNDERLALWKAGLDEALEEVRQAGKRKSRSALGSGLRSDIGVGRRWNVATDR